MKSKLFVFWGVVIAMMIVVSCQREVKRHPCRLYVFESSNKVYQIDFNGKDSLKTLCGTFELNPAKHIDRNGYVIEYLKIFSEKGFHLAPIYMHSSAKLNRKQACCLLSILERLNSKIISDTIKSEVKDVWNVCLFLEKQKVELQKGEIKDPDIKMLVDSMIEYSPLFINDYSNGWFGLVNELEMIRMFDKRKNR